MGCDIHGYFEAKMPSGIWVAFQEIPTNRDYIWFNLVGGQRGTTVKAHLHNRGMPSGSSQVWEDYCVNEDLHSHTWLTPDETLECFEDWLYLANDPASARSSAILRTKKCMFPEMPVKKIMFRHLGWQRGEGVYKELPWVGTVKDLIDDQEFETSVRMVITFDN